ncbi:MAG: nucleoside deaminase [Sphingobium sp.]
MSDLADWDKQYLRQAISLAGAAVDSGKRPFGAVIVDDRGAVISAGCSTQQDDRDWTAHAEMNVLRAAGRRLSWDELAKCTLYASSDPCPMCAGALYWSNVRRLVFGLNEMAMRPFRRDDPRIMGLSMTSREVLNRSPRPIEVIGPALIDEAIEPYRRLLQRPRPTEGWT